MNYYYYDDPIFESTEKRAAKRKKLRKLFSRFFLALSLYILISELLGVGVYLVASLMLSEEAYLEFASNYVWSIAISSGIQYLIAFPIFLLMLLKTDKARNKERTRLTVGDFTLLLLIGEVLMIAGSLIGNFLNNLIGAFMGGAPENNVATIVTEIPTWLIFVIMVVIGPIVEELIFRKLMIDRFSIYGDKMAILFSAVAFGVMHTNLYQFFYASFLGALLGYVYTLTRDVRYTVAMHMILNFMGSIFTLWAQEAMTEFYALEALASAGEYFDKLSYVFNGMIVTLYNNIMYGIMASGIFAIVHYTRKKKIRINSKKEVYLPDEEIVKYGVVNLGAILFLILTLALTVLNLFP